MNSVTTDVSGKPVNWLPFAGRCMIAAIFLLSGVSKLANSEATMGYIAGMGLPLPPVALGLSALTELVGSVLLVAGYRVRVVAAVLAGYCLVTALLFHFNLSDQAEFIQFFKNIAMAGGLVQIVAFGTGREFTRA